MIVYWAKTELEVEATFSEKVMLEGMFELVGMAPEVTTISRPMVAEAAKVTADPEG